MVRGRVKPIFAWPIGDLSLMPPPRTRYTSGPMDRPSEMTTSNWLLWQLIDSAFPVGAFAHSGGLEAAVQLGEVGSAEQVRAFVEASVQQCANLPCPFVKHVLESPGQYLEADGQFDAMLRNDIANRASRAQGQAMLATSADVWADQSLHDARATLKSGQWAGHLPIAFGLVAGTLRLDARTAIDAYLFCHLRSLLSAGVRLGVIGSREAQRLQSDLSQHRAQWLEAALALPIDDAAQTAPLLELLQAQHGRLYSRLFVS